MTVLYACAGTVADPVADARPDTPEPLVEKAEQPEESPSEPTNDTPDSSIPQPDDQTNEADPDEPGPASGEVTISFEYTRQSGPASNQHAVWIEDMDGKLIKSLFASRWTADGGYRTRPDSIALWAERAGLKNMSETEVDAVSGATPSSGLQTYIWDLTDISGETVPTGDYMFFVEGTLRWKSFVLYSGIITLGDSPVTVEGTAVFHYEGSERYDALTADSVENNMIGPVTATFTP